MNPEPLLPPERLQQCRNEPELRDQQLFQDLANYINYLIREDFNTLVQILYRMDVSEEKLKYVLNQNPNEDAGNIIASMMIERKAEAIRTKNLFRNSGEGDW